MGADLLSMLEWKRVPVWLSHWVQQNEAGISALGEPKPALECLNRGYERRDQLK